MCWSRDLKTRLDHIKPIIIKIIKLRGNVDKEKKQYKTSDKKGDVFIYNKKLTTINIFVKKKEKITQTPKSNFIRQSYHLWV